MSKQLKHLLPELVDSGYDAIYVLDDDSNDESREVTVAIDPGIDFVDGGENKGAAANRNRIMSVLGYDAIVHFIDADARIATDHMADVVTDTVPDESFGFIGGLAKTSDGLQSVWNYGPRQSLWSGVGGQLQRKIEPLLTTDPEKARKIRNRFSGLLEDWPDPLTEPMRRQVFWVVEQNFVVDSRTFARVGGFDENLREHGIQDLAIRMAKLGLSRYFDPSFATVHEQVDVRDYNRTRKRRMTELDIARKHGIGSWLLPDGHLKPRL